MNDPTCATSGCGRRLHARGLCNPCYGRLWRSGGIQPLLPIDIHSLSHVDKETATATCAICGPVKIRVRSDGRSPECMVARLASRTPESTRRARLRQKYNLTPLELAEMAEAQSGRCAICEVIPTTGLVVDHDHGTGRVRGLLCAACNKGLGFFCDDRARLMGAIKYLA